MCHSDSLDISKLQKGYPKIGWIIFLFCVYFISLGISWAVPYTYPVEDGTVDEFWECAFELPAIQYDLGVEIYMPEDQWFVYVIQGLEKGYSYKVSASQAMLKFDQYLEKLEKHISDGNASNHVVQGYLQWSILEPENTRDAKSLLTAINEARYELMLKDGRYKSHCFRKYLREYFDDFWRSTKWFWTWTVRLAFPLWPLLLYLTPIYPWPILVSVFNSLGIGTSDLRSTHVYGLWNLICWRWFTWWYTLPISYPLAVAL